MDKQTVAAASHLLGLVLGELVPAELRPNLQRTLDQMATELGSILEARAAATRNPEPEPAQEPCPDESVIRILRGQRVDDDPPASSIFDALHAEAQRSRANITGIARLVIESGAQAEHIDGVLRDHLLRQATSEQLLVHALLSLPRQPRDLH